MPITISAPSTLGSLLQGGLQGWDAAEADARANQSAQVSNLLRGMYIKELQRKMALEGNLAPALAELGTVAPESYTPTGVATPPQPGQPEEAVTAGGLSPGVPVSLEAGMPAIPGQPAPTGPAVTALTYSKIASALGPDKYQALLGTEAGRLALKGSGAITEEEFARRKRLADARLGFEEESKKAFEFDKQGDPLASLLAKAAALRHFQSVVDPEHLAPIANSINTIMAQYATAKKEPHELQLQKQDGPLFASMMTGLQKNGDFGAFMDGAVKLESQRYRQDADQVIKTIANGAELKNPNLTKFDAAVAAAWNEARGNGEDIPDQKAMYLKALTAVPEAGPELIRAALGGRRQMPEALQEILLGKTFPKTVWEAADRAVQGAGIRPNAPEYMPAFIKKLGEVEGMIKPKEPKETTIADLGAALNSHERELRDLIAEQRTLPKPSERLIMPPTEQAAANARDADLQKEIRDKRARIGEYQKRLDAAIGAKHPATVPPGTPGPIPTVPAPVPAPPAPVQAGAPGPVAAPLRGPIQPVVPAPAPGPTPPPAAPASADPRRAMPPPPNPTLADAIAERQRLLAAGHTPESAKAAMRQVGWQ